MWVHLTNSCNLNCNYCYISKNNEQMSYDTANILIKSLIHTTKTNKCNEVVVRMAGGEPLLNGNILKHIVKHVKDEIETKLNVNTRFAILTNGTLLDAEWVHYLRENNVNVSVSLDGTEEFHNKSRSYIDGCSSFDKVVRGITLCKSAGIWPTVLTTITEENLVGLPLLLSRQLNSAQKSYF